MSVISFVQTTTSEPITFNDPKHQVIIWDINPLQAIAFKDELLAAGLSQPSDFTWEFIPAQAMPEWTNNEAPTRRHATFNFSDSQLATFYKLKWI